MDALTMVAAIILVLLTFLGVFIFVDLAAMPGRIARKRAHPQTEAVNILGIVGMLTDPPLPEQRQGPRQDHGVRKCGAN